VTNTKSDPARILAASLDANPAISAEGIIQKFLVHWKLFTACALIVPLIAVSLSSLVPATYKSTAQLLIRVEGGSNVLYNGISPPIVALTGATTAEMIKSIPVASQMIETVGVEDADIARPAYKVLFGKAAALILPLLGREPTDQQLAANPKLKYAFLANELKPSVDATTLMMDHSTSSLRDELVNITVKANSREKVAAMVNGLCEAYITDYDLRSKNEIMTAYKTLGDQAAAAEADLARLRSAPARADVTPTVASADNSNTNPLSAGLAHTISDLETQLVVLRQTYAESSVEVIQAVAELKRDRALLAREQALDATTGLLSNIKARQHQLLLAATLYDTGQSNLSIVERGLTPKATKLVTVMRYGIPGAGGLVGGMFIGAIAILLLNLVDPRLFVESDISAASGRPVLGVIPASGVGPLNFAQLTDLPLAGARPALLQALGKLDLLDRDRSPVIVVTSAENESSTATVALQLAALLARNREGSVLLADANFDHPALTEAGAVKNEPGLLDVLAGSSTAIEAARPTKLPRLAFIGTGRLNLRDETGSSREGWIRFLEYGRKNYGVIVIHATGLLNSREAAVLAKNADQSLLVTDRQVSKKPCLTQASSLLAGIGAPVLGVIHCEVKP
jgi:Mrp family chromosome partitioning ATPase/capsular polysaccharide biosynthesis protein